MNFIKLPVVGINLWVLLHLILIFPTVSLADTDAASQITDVGPDGFGNYNAGWPSSADNSTAKEYLIVWHGNDIETGDIENGFEIFGQRIDAKTGAELGTNDFQISQSGPVDNNDYDALNPAVIYNNDENEYFVVWSADTNDGALVNDEFEIYGQRLSGAGTALGSAVRISSMGPDGDADYDASYPAVAYDSYLKRYFVVWQGDHNALGVREGEVEVFGRFVDASTGALAGVMRRYTDIGPLDDGYGFYSATYPKVAYDSSSRQYLIVFWADDNSHITVSNEEFEVFGQFVHPLTGAQLGTNDFQIADMGIFNLMLGYAGPPDVVADPVNSQFLVVWSGFHNTGSGISGQSFSGHEIFGQLIDANTRAETGDEDFRISDMGGNGLDAYFPNSPAAAYDSQNKEFLVAWASDNNSRGAVDGEFEIYLQRLTAQTGAEAGENDIRISFMGPAQDTSFSAESPAIAVNPEEYESLIVWNGVDNYIHGGKEIFAQFVSLNHADSLLTEFCFEWNSFLDMFNIAEFGNFSSGLLDVESSLYSSAGSLQSISSVSVLSGAQTDLLVHDMTGFTADSYGDVCSSHNGSPGEIDGRSVFYRPSASDYDFAFAVPFENKSRGALYVPFNTFQPSLDADDTFNLAANWIQLINGEEESTSGTLSFYNIDGDSIGSQNITLAAGERRDISAHQWGPNIAGLVAWVPDNLSAHFRMRNVRYYYDNADAINSFDSAFQIGGRSGTGHTVYAPIDTREGSSILEIANASSSKLEGSVSIYDEEGTLITTFAVDMDAYASKHIIMDGYLSSALGLAKLSVTSAANALMTVMQYGRTASLGITYVYGIESVKPLGTSLQGSYNTFLGQGCSLLVINSAQSAQTISVSMVRYDGTNVLTASTTEIPASGIEDIDLCANEPMNAYGVVRVDAAEAHSLVAYVIRKGAGDNYRFPTQVR